MGINQMTSTVKWKWGLIESDVEVDWKLDNCLQNFYWKFNVHSVISKTSSALKVLQGLHLSQNHTSLTNFPQNFFLDFCLFQT
jgi:hypothetical protein